MSTNIKEFHPFNPHGHNHVMMSKSLKKFTHSFHMATTMLFVFYVF